MSPAVAPAVGIFDSGLGGLSVWAAIRRACPNAPCLYLADQAHMPYGPRPDTEIRALSLAISDYLMAAGARLIVVACNTASAAALATLRAAHPGYPFVGMEPAVKPAALATRSGVVGLMATRGTLRGALLRNTAARFAGQVDIVSSECPGLAEAIERGATESELEERLREHVAPLLARGADHIVLGCTHYPLAQTLLQEIVGPTVTLLDPAPAVARQVARLWCHADGDASDRFATTGDPTTLRSMLARSFGLTTSVQAVKWAADREHFEVPKDGPFPR